MTAGHYRSRLASATVKPMRHTITRRIAITSALALTALGLSGPAAFAEENEEITVKGGSTQFENNEASQTWRELLWVEDTKYDGRSLRAYLTYYDGSGNRLTQSVNAPNFANPDDRVQYLDLQIPEGRAVKLKLCYFNNGHRTQCSRPQRGYA